MKARLADPRRLVRKLDFPLRAPTTPLGAEPLPDKPRTGAHYDTEWARSFPARVARALLLESLIRPVVRVLADPERVGIDRLDSLRRQADEADGVPPPVIFAANHHSHVDAPLLLSSIPEPWRHKIFAGAAADYFFKTRITSAASALALNAIPIERTKVTRRSADLAAELIDDGWSMAIFPEGGRSPDGWGQPFRGGAAYLAIRCKVPVVPVHLQGTSRILRKGKSVPTPASTLVTFGAPIRPDEGEDSRRFAARIERAVAALADEASTDWYTARLRAHRDDSPPLTGPEATGWRRQWALGDRGPKKGRIKPKRWPDLS